MKRFNAAKVRAAVLAAGFKLAHESYAKGGVAVSAEEGDDPNNAGNYYAAGSYSEATMTAMGLDGFGINQRLVDIAQKHGGFCEWYDPAIVTIHAA